MTFDTANHKDILVKILKDIFSDQVISSDLGFKDGTAALLFYNLSRFSVDLDFDLLDSTKKDTVFGQVNIILQSYGTVKKADKKRYNLFFLLAPFNKLKDAQNIKIEINTRNFGSRYELKEYLGIPMKVMVQEDMAAHKMVAMYERMGEANRDIFDVWFFLHNNWPINIKIIEQRTNMTYKKFLQTCIDKLDSINNRSILSGLGELLTEKQKAWVKSKLKDETIFLLKAALNSQK